MSLSLDQIYVAPRLRVLYSTCLTEKNIQDLLSANNIFEFYDVLKETYYYSYVRGVSPRDMIGFELALNTYLYNLANTLSKYSYDISLLVDIMRKISLANILVVLMRALSTKRSRELESIRGLVPPEHSSLVEDFIREEISLAKVIDTLKKEGFENLDYYFREFSKLFSPETTIIYALDLSIMDLLYTATVNYPEISGMSCPEMDQYFLNFSSKIILKGLATKLESLLPRLALYTCSLSKEIALEILSSDDLRALSILRRYYPSTIISQDLADSVVSIRGYLRKVARRNAVTALFSYPFTYSLLWAVFTLKRYDIEDLISIAMGKIGLVSNERIRRLLSQ